MTRGQATDAYNLVCRIEELEKFVETLNDAERITINIDYSKSRHIDSTYSFTLYSGEIDNIKEILAVFTKKLESLKKQLEEM